MKTQNVEFVEALKILAADTGVELPKDSRRAEPSKRAAQDAAMQEALSFFKSQLERNKDAKEYCERRGLDEAARQTWELGYAPHEGSALATQLKKKGHLLTECRSLFLVEEDSRGGYFDRFRGRLMFPIRDERGDLVAFGGRILGDGHPKYVNSGDTPLFHKSRVLYGMYRAKESIAKERKAVLTEGYLDVIACHQAGVVNAIASLGTALTEDHAKILKRWCDGVIVLYDSDSAGQKAAERAIEVLEPAGLKVRIVLLPQGEDPDTMLRRDGPGALKRSIEKLLTPTEYRLELLKRRVGIDKDEFWNGAVEVLAAAPTEREIEVLLMALSPLHPHLRDKKAAHESLRRDVFENRRSLGRNGRTNERLQVKVFRTTLGQSERFLFRAFLQPALRPYVYSVLGEQGLFETAVGQALAEDIRRAFPVPPEGAPSNWIHELNAESQQALTELDMTSGSELITLQFMEETVRKMRDGREAQQVRDLKSSQIDDNVRTEYLNRLKKLKGGDK